MHSVKRTAHFDCRFGAGGDMLLACLLDASTAEEQEVFFSSLKKIAIDPASYNLRLDRVSRCSITASRIRFDCHDSAEERNLSSIKEIIEKSQINRDAKMLSERIFERLAQAEAIVHGTAIEQVHFHEIGALDSILDILGFAIAFSDLGIESSSCTALPLGSGTVKTRHGLFPVPAPAVLELVKEAGAPISNLTIPFECLTPTAAAILCELCTSWEQHQPFKRIVKSGTGAGAMDSPDHPNIARVFIAVAEEIEDRPRFRTETVAVIETNIDDQSPQTLAYVAESLYQLGALDVLTVPCLMKKGRSGHLLSVICHTQDAPGIKEKILTESSSLGVRYRFEERLVTERRFLELEIDGHNVNIKIAADQEGTIVNVQPEFKDLAQYARLSGLSIKEAQENVMSAYRSEAKKLKRAKAVLSKSLATDGEDDV